MYTLQRYRRVAFAICCGLLAVASFFILLPFWSALAWGVALSILVYPIHVRLNRRLNDTLSAGLTTAFTLVLIVVPVCFLVFATLGEVNQVLKAFQEDAESTGNKFTISAVVDQASAAIRPIMQQIGIKDFDLKSTLQKTLEPLMAGAPALFGRAIHLVLTWVFALLLLFFILRDGHKLRQPAIDLIPLPEDKSIRVIKSIYDTVHATFYGVLLIAILNGIIISLLFSWLGLPSPLLWGVITVGASIVPIAGAPLVYLPWAAFLAYHGLWWKAIILLLVGILIVSFSIDKIYKSVLIGQRVQLHPMAVFFSLLGGVFTVGAAGIFVGPVVLIMALGAIEVIREMAETEEPESPLPVEV